jgi:acetyl/propionyl-CoA carboxylase alpha subunit
MGYIARMGDREIPVAVKREGDLWRVTVGERTVVVDAYWDKMDLLSLLIDGHSYGQVDIHGQGDAFEVLVLGDHFSFELFDERKALAKKRRGLAAEGVQEVRTSMPGKIVAVEVAEGDKVEAGQGLVVVEAMKMENEIRSPKAGVVTKVGVKAGQAVEAGTVLVVVE